MICDRCHREVHKSPVFVGEMVFGPVCAKAIQPPEVDTTAELFFDLEYLVLVGVRQDSAGARERLLA